MQNFPFIHQMDEFLTFGQVPADPWNRVGCIRKPNLLVIEFCQIQGPRPLYWYPKDDGEAERTIHLLEDIAVWLMSSENMHANFCSLFNQQLGIHIIVQYATMLDITARAFQRPFAIALLMPSQPGARDFELFRHQSAKLLLPLLSCNRRFVHSILRHTMELMANSDQKNVQSYYSTSGNAQQIVIVSNKIKSVIQQTRAWYERMAEKIANGENSVSTEECYCECSKEELRTFIGLLSQKQSSCELVHLTELAPCKGTNLEKALETAYENLTGKQRANGLIFCGTFAVIKSTFGANSELQNGSDENQEASPEEHIASYFIASKENTLKALSSISNRLLRCVYQLLIGERVLILASKQRCYTGIDLLYKLNSLRVYRRPEIVKWAFESKNNNLFDPNQLCGVSCSREQSIQWSASEMCQNFVIIDINNYRMRAREYIGQFLGQLSGRRNFPSDASVIAFVASVVTDLHQLLLLSRYISPEAVINQMKLTASDQLLLFHCLAEFNLTKYTHLDKRKREMLENMPYKKFKF